MMKGAGMLLLDGDNLTLDALAKIALNDGDLDLTKSAWGRVRKGRDVVDAAMQGGKAFYGINTGVGSQKDRRLQVEEIEAFNAAVIVSESTNLPGPSFEEEVVRAALVVLLNNAATGRLGIRPELVNHMLGFFRTGQMPEIRRNISVGGSDLGPLAQLARAFLELPQDHQGVGSFRLAAKEAVSLINNNSFAIAHGAIVLNQAAHLLRAHDLATAVSLEAHRGNLSYLRPEMAVCCSNEHQEHSFEAIRGALAGSQLWAPENWRELHDPLSFRFAMRVHGAVNMAHDAARRAFQGDLNCVCDNPVVSFELGEIVTGLNMDSTPLTCTMDMLRQSLAMAASTSFERATRVQNPALSGLPAAFADPERAESGVQNMVIPHLTAARMAELRSLSAPVLLECPYAIVDGVIDVSGMAPLSVQRTEEVLEIGWLIVASEIVIALWAIKLRGLPRESLGAGVRNVYDQVGPLLPMGREGQYIFDFCPVLDVVKTLVTDIGDPC